MPTETTVTDEILIYSSGEVQRGFEIKTEDGQFTFIDTHNKKIFEFPNIAECLTDKGKTILSLYVNIGKIEPNSLSHLNVVIGIALDEAKIHKSEKLSLSQLFSKLFDQKEFDRLGRLTNIESSPGFPFISGILVSAVVHGKVFKRAMLSELEEFPLEKIKGVQSCLMQVREALYIMGRSKKNRMISEESIVDTKILENWTDLDNQTAITPLIDISEKFDFSEIDKIITRHFPDLSTDCKRSIQAGLMKELFSGVNFSKEEGINTVQTHMHTVHDKDRREIVLRQTATTLEYKRDYVQVSFRCQPYHLLIAVNASCPHFGGNKGQCPIEH